MSNLKKIVSKMPTETFDLTHHLGAGNMAVTSFNEHQAMAHGKCTCMLVAGIFMFFLGQTWML